MLRTRAALLDAAAASVQDAGVRGTTMADLAVRAGVAKATLYNHFRTKDDVLAALVAQRVEALADAATRVAAERGPVPALVAVADAVADAKPLRKVVADEPVVALRLAVPGDGAGWDAVRAAVARVLAAAEVPADRTAVDVVLRWALGQALWPGSPEEVALGAAGVAEALARHVPAAEPAAGPAAGPAPEPATGPAAAADDLPGQRSAPAAGEASAVDGAASGRGVRPPPAGEGLGWPGGER